MQADILEVAKQHGQGHLVEHYETLKDPALKEEFLKQLRDVDFKQVNQLYKEVYLSSKQNTTDAAKVEFQPLKHVVDRAEIKEREAEFDQLGFAAIARGEIGVCIMSGGQGTRLGFDHPKGMYNLGLDGNYTLFEFFIRRMIRLNELAKQKFPDSKWNTNNMIKFYLLTSEMNHN